MTSIQNNFTTVNGSVNHDFKGNSQVYILGTNILLTLPINVYVLWLIVSAGKDQVASNFFALNLSVIEIFFCLGSFIYLQAPEDMSQYISYILAGLIYTGRPLFQSCICVERYLAVVHPVVFLKYKTVRYKTACVGLGWILVFGSCLCFVVIFVYKSDVYDTYYLLCNYLVWFSLKLFCCLAVLRALKRPGPGDREREVTNSMKLKAFKIILIILITAVINYLPMIITILVRQFINVVLAIQICFYTAYLTGLVQPLLFIHRAGKMPCIRHRHKPRSPPPNISNVINLEPAGGEAVTGRSLPGRVNTVTTFVNREGPV